MTQFGRYIGLFLVSFVFLSACSNLRPAESPVVIPEVVVKPEIVIQPVVPEIIKPANISVLVSSTAKVYGHIADKLEASKNFRITKYVMSGYDNRDAQLLAAIQESPNKQVVVIGLRAARSAMRLLHKQVIFCQVFDHKNEQLSSGNMKGVSILPSADKLLKDWKIISPGIRKIVLITGTGLDNYINSAKQAAERNGIDLTHLEVNTDKEYLYTTKNLPLDVQGFWLLPDNRVLSLQVLKDVMAFNSKAGRQMVVFNRDLLSFGGLMSTEPDLDEVSMLIKKRLANARGLDHVPGEDVVLLNEHQLSINKKVAGQLGIVIPEKFMAKVYD
ncbi:MAG: hypothetical protein OEY43_06750 [Gammaproteobacteria bacterium]|nr:hypothetical protein [Gammaproteobacteria bacterium]